MTEPFHTRAAEIVAAYGADPARWPDAERATALHVIAASPELKAALAAAKGLDADLVAWARTPVGGGDAVAAATQAIRTPWALRSGRWAVGGALAASLAAGLLWLVPVPHPARAPIVAVTASDDANAFAQVFTPTPDEEQVL